MSSFWDKQIDRADALASEPGGSKELLIFYGHLLRAQKGMYEQFCSRPDQLASRDLERDLPMIRTAMGVLLETVALHGPESLASEAHILLDSDDHVVQGTLIDYWHDPSDVQFFAKATIQPYARWLIDSGSAPIIRELTFGESRCPHCGGAPQVSSLQNKETTAESGNRDLICATCLGSWEFRRVVCAYCGEERPAKLGYFHSPEFNHVRIEACDTCKHYIKGVDLTRLGHAAPLVDDIYSAPLDLWAREHGYTKIELNLVGV